MLLVRQLSGDFLKNKLFESAILALEAGDVDVALSKSKQLIEADPKDPFALVIAADCFNFYGKEQEGLGLLQAAVAASERNPIFSLPISECSLSAVGRASAGTRRGAEMEF